jgi:hypothetical protein
MLVKFNNNTYIIKFKYASYVATKELKFKKREALLQYEHQYTLVMFRNILDSHEDYIYMRVDCNDNDVFDKSIGREIAFKKLLFYVIKDNDFRKVCIEAYNKTFSKKPLNVNETMAIINQSL